MRVSDDGCSDTGLVPSGRERLSPPPSHPFQLWICDKAGRNQRVADRLDRLEKAKGEVNVFEAASGAADK